MGQSPSSGMTANSMHEQRDRGPLLQRQHAVQQDNLSSAAQRVAQPTVSDRFQLQSSLPYGNNQFSRAGLAGEHDGSTMPMSPNASGEQLPLFYWWGLAAWNMTRGTARVDLMRPRWLVRSCHPSMFVTFHAPCLAISQQLWGKVLVYPSTMQLQCCCRFPDLAPGNSLFHAAPKRGKRRSARYSLCFTESQWLQQIY